MISSKIGGDINDMSVSIYEFLKTKGIKSFIRYELSIESIATQFDVSQAYVYKCITDIEPNVQQLKEQFKSQMVQELYDLCENGVSLDIIWSESLYFKRLNYQKTITKRVLKQKLSRLFKQEHWDIPLLLTKQEITHYYLRLLVNDCLKNENLTQMEVAQRFNVAQSFVAKIKRDGAFPINTSEYEQSIIRRNYKILKGERKLDDQKLMDLIFKSIDRGLLNGNTTWICSG